MQLAFYAPLKAADHPVPSGDRAMARALIAAMEFGGAQVTLASDLRSRDGAGDAAVQQRLFDTAKAEVARLIPQGRRENWAAWITYHNYYKAPDLIGPAVAKALNIPYLLIESTRARKRLTGPWARFAQAAEDASNAADVIFYLTQRDAQTLERDKTQGQTLIHLRPFLARQSLPAMSLQDGPMLSVGMLRSGDKLASYRIIAETLHHLPTGTWALDIAGDGSARPDVEALMAPFGNAVRFLGQLDAADLEAVYGRASLLFWPGVNEAFGLAYLEAQATGLPIVAQLRPGVCDVLAPGNYPHPEDGITPMSLRLQALLAVPSLRTALGERARSHVASHHLLPTAAATLRGGLAKAGVTL